MDHKIFMYICIRCLCIICMDNKLKTFVDHKIKIENSNFEIDLLVNFPDFVCSTRKAKEL